jgi:putative inorganic carbon (hco3(-)) transporter
VGFGLGLIHFVPLIAYIGFWIMCLVSLTGRPLYGFYYLIPFLPYRTMRDHFLDYPLGGNVLTILVFSVIVGAVLKGKRLPKSSLYALWFVMAVYLYFSMWYGTALGNCPAPLWVSDANFATWKDYILIPLVFVAAGMLVEDRKAVRTVILITAAALLFIDRSCLLESLSRSWGTFNEDKRSGGPLGYGSNQTAAFLVQFGMFFWGLVQFVKRKKYRLICYGLVALTILAIMYTFSRGAYAALLISIFVLGVLKDRKLLLLGAVFLVTWQLILPAAVQQRVNMTQDSSGQLDASAQVRVKLWDDAKDSMLSSPMLGTGFATYQYSEHLDNLKDTHNWYIKVMVETGLVGMLMVLVMFQQILALSYRLFREATDPLYKGLGLGLLTAIVASLITNLFGDRWTYLEITGLLWVLVGTAVRALQMEETEPAAEGVVAAPAVAVNPYMVYR